MYTKFKKKCIIIKMNNNTIHECPKCGGKCKGKMCKVCHLKLMKEKEGNCIDCKKKFEAKRNDGTYKKRCNICQTKFEINYLKNCENCKNEFLALDIKHTICRDCFKSSPKCLNCNDNTTKDFKLCNKCFYIEKQCKNCGKSMKRDYELCLSCEKNKNNLNKNSNEKNDEFIKTCRNNSCINPVIGKSIFCKDCNIKLRPLTDIYMVFTCVKCGLKGRGDHIFCKNCK